MLPRAMTEFLRIKCRVLLAVLTREPLGYQVVRQKGSHRVLRAPGRPQLLVAYREGEDVPPGVVRNYLVKI